MEYFRIKQDPESLESIIIPDVINQIHWRYVTPENAHKIKEITVFPLSGGDNPKFIDLLDRQLFLLSSQIKDTFDLYVPKLKYKTVILVNDAKKLQHTYHLPIFVPVDCLSEKSTMASSNKAIKHLVVEQAAIGRAAIFKVKHDYENIIIARLDAAESILRRHMTGIKMYRVDLE